MTQHRRELLDDALCLIDEDLLARVLANRPQKEGRGARRLITVFGRQMPAVLASVVAVGILVVCVAAVPGMIRLVRLLTDMTPPTPQPPVGGSVAETEQRQDSTGDPTAETEQRQDSTDDPTAEHIHDWSPWVPWGDDKHERHCQDAACGKQVWEKHAWFATQVDEDGMLFHCEQCNSDHKDAADSPNLLRNLPSEGIVSMELYEDVTETSRIITSPTTIKAIADIFRNAEYVPESMENIADGLPRTITVLYADGRTIKITTLSSLFSITGEDGCSRRQYLSEEDARAMGVLLWVVDAEMVPDSTGTLMVNGEKIDCGTTRPRFREYPHAEVESGYISTVLLPLTVTLRALGAEIGEITDGETQVTYAGKTYHLSIPERKLCAEGETYNLLTLAPGDVGYYVEVEGDELMVDTRILMNSTMFFLSGNRILWDTDVRFENGIVHIRDKT